MRELLTTMEIKQINDHWGWFIDIERGVNYYRPKQIVRISNNYKLIIPKIRREEKSFENFQNILMIDENINNDYIFVTPCNAVFTIILLYIFVLQFY